MLMKSSDMSQGSEISQNSPTSRSLFSRLQEGAWLKTLKTWRQKSRQRQALTNLDDDFLNDIGLSRDDVWRESSKPFWS